MDNRVLVAYGTKYGSTEEIAERIGQVLQQAGLQVDVLRADRVSNLPAYQAVVLGSGVYIGRWRKEAVKFLKANEEVLVGKMVWLFSSGPTGEGDPEELLQGWQYPSSLQPIVDKIQPRGIAVFHGSVDVDKLNAIEKWMLRNVKSPTGDFRDWEQIASWAAAIAGELQEGVAA